MNRLLPIILTLALVLSPASGALAQQLTNPGVGRIKTDIARRLRDQKTSVTLQLRNGIELKGRITQAAENLFTLKDTKTGSQRYISYTDVTTVRERGLSKGAKFSILTATITGAVIIGALISLKRSSVRR